MIKMDFVKIYDEAQFLVKRNCPELLIGASIVGIVISMISACKATTKVGQVLEDTKFVVDCIHDDVGNADKDYTRADANKDLARLYFDTGVNLIKLYGPSIVLGGLSISGIVASNNILRNRNLALAASYIAIDNAYKQYRARVAERIGEEAERDIRYNLTEDKIEETVLDENGKEKKVKKTIKVIGDTECSPYARIFDELNPYWEKDYDLRMFFLRQQRQYAEDKLIIHKYLFLNDVYDLLGFPKTKKGQVVGWIYEPDNKIGDNYVDFGVFDIMKQGSRDFINGYEPAILLDFNIDGPILERIKSFEDI